MHKIKTNYLLNFVMFYEVSGIQLFGFRNQKEIEYFYIVGYSATTFVFAYTSKLISLILLQ